MSEMAKEENVDWQRKRKITMVSFCVIAFGLGLEYSLVFPSLWFYYNDIIKASHAKLFYGSALSAYPVASIIGAFTIGRYIDRTRRTRFALMCLITVEIVGNLIYTLYYSPWAPLIGRFLSGFGDVCYMVMGGEIARCYETKDITKQVSYMVSCFSVGFVVAPSANVIFAHVHVNLNGFEITFGNMPGIIMACVFTMVLLCTICFVHDLSKEYDLKDDSQKTHSTFTENECGSDMTLKEIASLTSETVNLLDSIDEIIQEENSPKQETVQPSQNHLKILLNILKCPDLVLLLAFCFVSSYTLFSFDTLLSLVVSHYFGLGVTVTSTIFIGIGIAYFGVLMLLGYASRRFSDYHLILFAFVILICGLSCLFTLTVYHGNFVFKYFLLVIYVLAFCVAWSIEEVLTRSLFSKLVPSWCQSYAEGVRRSVSSCAFVIGGVTSSGLFDYLTYLSVILIFISIIFMGLFMKRKRNLVAVQPLF